MFNFSAKLEFDPNSKTLMCIKVWQGSNQTGQVMVVCRWNRVIKPNFVSDLLSGLTALDYYFELHAVHCDIVHYITEGLRVLRFCLTESNL